MDLTNAARATVTKQAIATSLRAISVERGITVTAIAARVGVGEAAIRHLTRANTFPRVDTFVNLIREFPEFGARLGVRLIAADADQAA